MLTPADDWIVITLDPGHGGSGGGSYRYNGEWLKETECMLKIAYYLKAELETYDHVRVVLTRETNSEEEYRPIYEIADRIKIGEDHCNDIFVSLHANGSDSHDEKGACVIVPMLGTYRPELAEECHALAGCILSHLSEAGLSYNNGGLLTRASEDNTRYPDGSLADYYGVAGGGMRSNFVSVLVEHCFLDNYEEASKYLLTEEGLQTLAHADCMGIVDYLGLQKATAEQLKATENQYFLTDYRWNWAKSNIDRAILEGWVKGYEDDTFRPARTVTRGEFVSFLGRAAGVENVCQKAPFPDVPADKYCAAYVRWAADNGIVAGFNKDEFRPDALITREQIAKIMACYLRYLGCDIGCTYSLEDYDIADIDSIGAWSRPYVTFCYEKQLLLGTSAGTFAPKRSATRAEACAVLVRMIDYAAAHAAPLA